MTFSMIESERVWSDDDFYKDCINNSRQQLQLLFKRSHKGWKRRRKIVDCSELQRVREKLESVNHNFVTSNGNSRSRSLFNFGFVSWINVRRIRQTELVHATNEKKSRDYCQLVVYSAWFVLSTLSQPFSLFPSFLILMWIFCKLFFSWGFFIFFFIPRWQKKSLRYVVSYYFFSKNTSQWSKIVRIGNQQR